MLGMAAGLAGLTAGWLWMPWPSADPFLRLMQGPEVGMAVVVAYWFLASMYWAMWVGIPYFIVLGIVRRCAPVSVVGTELGELDVPAGERDGIYAVMGEFESGRLAVVKEKSLLCNTIAVGAIRTGKSTGFVIPVMDQLLVNRTGMGGLILDPNGDLQRHASRTLGRLGRRYIDIGPDGYSYNPLAGSFDPHSMATNIAELVSNLAGEPKEPYWTQSYKEALAALIRIHMLTDEYVTFVDLFESLLDEDIITAKIGDCKRLLDRPRLVLMPEDVYRANRSYAQTLRTSYGFQADAKRPGFYSARWSGALLGYLKGPAGNPRFEPGMYAEVEDEGGERKRESVWLRRFEFWLEKSWQKRDELNRINVVTSVTGPLLMGIWDNDAVREMICPPKEAYEGGWTGKPVLRSMDELVDDGVVAGVTMPQHWASGIVKTVNVLVKLNFQLTVQRRMASESVRHKPRPCLLVMDEYPSMATTSERSTVGDDVFMARNTRRGRCVVLAAAQSIGQIKPLISLFRNKLYLACDPETAVHASEECGKQWVMKDSLSLNESNQSPKPALTEDRLLSRDGGTGLSRSWSPHYVPVFEPRKIMGQGTNEAVALLLDEERPMPPARLKLKPVYDSEVAA
jgi:hypothetical protein